MKIGIMTFWWSEDNYGQILQCYALQKYLRDAGHDAYLIRYDARNDYVKSSLGIKLLKALNPVKLYKYILYQKKVIINRREKENYPRNFEVFRKKYLIQTEIIYKSYKELMHNPPVADVYIVGSDQVWNPGYGLDKSKKCRDAFFLNFGLKKIKRMSYAASFGQETISDEFSHNITPLLSKFNYISVREKSGIDICHQCGIDNAEWVPDPTMLISPHAYRMLCNNEKVRIANQKKYLFLYLLGNRYDFPIEKIYEWAVKQNLEVIYVTGNAQHDSYEKIYATIPEWLFGIDNAEYVITNSYHCCVFSLLFNKKFGVISLSGSDMGLNDRFLSLFEFFSIEKRFVGDNFIFMEKEINWSEIHKVFDKLQASSKLKSILEGYS
jgi:hypothetical protein